MILGPRQRWVVLLCALLASIAASAWTWRRNAVIAQVAQALPLAGHPASGKAAQTRPAIATNRRQATTAAAADLFAAVNWDTPLPPLPATPPLPVTPAEPQPPPLPFEYFGRTKVVGERGTLLIHLRRGKEVYSVQEGEQIDQDYRLDKAGAEGLEIAYLPLSTRQILVIGPK